MSNDTKKRRTLAWYFKEFIYFLGSKLFIFNTLGLALALVGTVVLSYWGLGCYTHHGSSITVPALKGLTLKQVETLLDNRGLSYIVMDSIYDPNAKPLQVMDQEPVSNSKVKVNRTIYLTVNATEPPSVKLPNLIGKSLEIGTRNLNLRGLRVAATETRPDPAANTVLEVRYNGKILKPGDQLPKGAGVTLIVADGIGDTELEIPNLMCRTVDEAKFVIKSNNLNLGAVIVDGSVRDTLKAFVWKQNPEATPGEKMRMGEQIDVWITSSAPAGCGGN